MKLLRRRVWICEGCGRVWSERPKRGRKAPADMHRTYPQLRLDVGWRGHTKQGPVVWCGPVAQWEATRRTG